MACWEAAASDTDVVSLLIIIRDVMHNKKERAQSTMGLVESNMVLYTTTMNGADTLDKYYRIFKAQVDTIEAHGGNPGHHGAVYCKHYKAIMVSKGYNTKEKLDILDNAEIKNVKSMAPKTSTEVYLGCLSLMMADGRYKLVNKFLHEVFLVEKQQYLRDVLAMKRFMVNIIGMDTGKPQRQQQQQPKTDPDGAGVACVSPEK